MSETIIACKMIENEVEQARVRAGNDSPVIYIDRGLHEYPDRLRDKIQELLLSTRDDYVLLAYGLCGNALHTVSSPHSTIVMPRFHDCIQMMLVTEERPSPSTCPDCLYYTDGWFDSEDTMIKQYRRFAERKGEEKARRAYQRMLQHYRNICLINTGCGFRPSSVTMAEKTGELFDLALREEEGSTNVLERLFAHEWDDDFIVCPPGQPVSQNDFRPGVSSVAGKIG